jgi:hypothetical protein
VAGRGPGGLPAERCALCRGHQAVVAWQYDGSGRTRIAAGGGRREILAVGNTSPDSGTPRRNALRDQKAELVERW